MESESEIKEYNSDIETLFIQFMLSNHELYVRCSGILQDTFFDNTQNRDAVSMMMSHFKDYSTLPDVNQIRAVTGKSVELIPEVAAKEDRWFLKEIEYFCRYKSLRDAILMSPDLLDKGSYGEVESLVKSAVQIALVKDLGTDYYANPKERLEAIREGKGQLSTGWKDVDEKLYGGLNKGEITIFAGQCVTADTTVMAVKVLDLDEYFSQSGQHIGTEDKMICEKMKYLSQFYSVDRLMFYKEKDTELFEKLYHDMQPQEYKILDLHAKEDKWFVDSPDGLVPVLGLISKGSYNVYRTTFTDDTYVHSSGLHCFENTHGGWIAPINLVPGYALKTKEGQRIIKDVINTGIEDLVFDLVVDSENHRYYTNGVSSHNSGAGKSLFLQNLAVNWAMAGLSVVYLSLELSEKLCAMRIDAMHTGYETRDVMRNIDDVHMKIRASQQKSKGALRIKQLPNGCTSNDIRAFIKEYEIHSGRPVDAILVDYLDLMMPMSKKISAENLFVKDKYVTEELRNLAVELQIVTVSASQLNRGSYEEIEFDPSHIAGGISKVNTADNVIGIFTSAAMRDGGRYQIQFMKTRSSSGVGSKVDLSFDKKSLRIEDLDEEDEGAIAAASKGIYEQLKKKSVIREGEKLDTSTGEITKESSKSANAIEGAASLRAFLKKR